MSEREREREREMIMRMMKEMKRENEDEDEENRYSHDSYRKVTRFLLLSKQTIQPEAHKITATV